MIGKNGLYPQANRFLQQHWELHVEVLTSNVVTTESPLFLCVFKTQLC